MQGRVNFLRNSKLFCTNFRKNDVISEEFSRRFSINFSEILKKLWKNLEKFYLPPTVILINYENILN